LDEILKRYQELAVCYAMKEEINGLFLLRAPIETQRCWNSWFEAAKGSGIAARSAFAVNKEKWIDSLIALTTYINTGKLKEWNNKTKVSKRLAYGYRNEEYFFTLIKYLTIPS